MTPTIEPEPSDDERAAILAALGRPEPGEAGWAEASLLEGVDDAPPDP